MERCEVLFDSRAAMERLVAATVPERQAVAFVRLVVQVIERKLARDHRHLEESSASAGSDIPFDTRTAANELVAAGAPEPHADALASLLLQWSWLDIAVTRVV